MRKNDQALRLSKFPRGRAMLTITLLLNLLLSPQTSVARTVTQAASATPADSAALVAPFRVEPAALDAELEKTPDLARALVVDESNPGWVTRYGTEAGVRFLPPHQPPTTLRIDGAEPPVRGTWRKLTVQAGAGAIYRLAYTADGRLFTSIEGELHVYQAAVNGLASWQPVPGAPIPSGALATLGNELWVGTNGIARLNLSDGVWSILTTANSPLPSNSIRRFTPVVDPNGPDYIWINTDAGVARYTPGSPATWTVLNPANGFSYNVADIAVQFVGNTTYTWFATTTGLVRWDGANFKHFAEGGECYTAGERVRRVVVDRQGALWFIPERDIPAIAAAVQSTATNTVTMPTTDGPSAPQLVTATGVCRYNSTGFVTTWTLFHSTSPGLPEDASNLSLDHAGRIWMSFYGSIFGPGGAAVYDNGTWKIYRTTNSPLYNSTVTTVLAGGETVWWGHDGAPVLTSYSPNWDRTTAATLSDVPHTIYLEATRTWAALNAKIGWTDGNTSVWHSQAIPGNTSPVRAFARGGDNRLWIGTQGNGVFAWDGNTFVQYTVADGLPGNNVNALLTDYLGRVWVGTSEGLAMRAEAGYWLTFTTGSSPLLSNLVNTLAQDEGNRLWIGTPSGISVLDLVAGGWSAQTTATGLPANSVNALVSDPVGAIWAATTAGVAAWDAASQSWTIYNKANLALPHDETTLITADPQGRIWVATQNGVALRQGTTWQHFFVPGTSIESNIVTGLAADNKRTWVAARSDPAAESAIATRAVLTSPIGSAIPQITSFSPEQAGINDTITINGNHFDDRAPWLNKVYFTDRHGFLAVEGQIVSATKTMLQVKVPALASSGKLQVVANELKSPLSATAFKLMPKITGLSATCLGIGSELQINGSGFMDAGAPAYVKIGDGAERLADATDPLTIRTFIRPGDTAGPVRVRLVNNSQALSAQSVTIAEIEVKQVLAQQAIQGERMIYGKNTLVQLSLVSKGCQGAKVTQATLNWKFADGWTLNGGLVNYPTGKLLPLNEYPISVDYSVSVVGELYIDYVSDHYNLPSWLPSLTFFDGASVTLKNNAVTLMTIQIPRSTFNFIDTSLVRRHLTAMMVTGDTDEEKDPDFDQHMFEGFATLARIYPQHDGWYYSGRFSWLHDTPMWYELPYKVKIGSGGNHSEARGLVGDYLEPGGNRWAVALIDRKNLTEDSDLGFNVSFWSTIVAANAKNKSGYVMMHELLHNFGFVAGDAPNYQPSDKPGADNHSKYDEGQWDRDGKNFDDCKGWKDFQQALVDFTGDNKRVVRLTYNSAFDMSLNACGFGQNAPVAQKAVAKSVISYAPRRSNGNTFLEPIDYREAIDQLCEDGGCLGYTGQLSPLAAQQKDHTAMTATDIQATNTATRTLRLSGQIHSSGQVTPSLSYVALNEGELTPQQPGGEYRLLVLAADDTVLHEQRFAREGEPLAPHDGDLDHTSHEASDSVSLFQLRVPFPLNAVKAQIRKADGALLWSQQVSANAPTVSLGAPNGGLFNATNVIPVTWSASDPDGDALQFGLDYSPDGGNTWILIIPRLNSPSFNWTPRFAPASTNARLRVRVSDGFNTATALSAPFTLTPRPPEAIVLAPEVDELFTEGEIVTLRGTSVTSAGFGAGSFVWQAGPVTLGATATVTVPLTTIGVQTFTLQATHSGLSASRSVSITVVPDYDRDRLPNAWESYYQFNPLDASDATGDADSDSLSNIDEFHRGTNPRNPDTDDDGLGDKTELDAGADPLNPQSKPATEPILNVGSVAMGFTLNSDSPLPEPKQTWVTNSGGGVLNWTATVDQPWITVTPASGAAPQALTVGYSSTGLASGTYTGKVTVSAPGASGTPHEIVVTLKLDSITAKRNLYLPLVQR